jgi:hypothetical protein
MEPEAQYRPSRLFTIRVWQEKLGSGEAAWRGSARDSATGMSAYFQAWSGLVGVLARLAETPVPPPDERGQ